MNLHFTAGLALLALTPAALPCARGAFDCEVVLVRAKCVRAVATGVNQSGQGVSASGSHVDNNDPNNCPKLVSFERTFYQERNGKPGYQEGEDTMVSQNNAHVDVPSNEIDVGAFTNKGSGGEYADSWELTVVDENGGTNTFGGGF